MSDLDCAEYSDSFEEELMGSEFENDKDDLLGSESDTDDEEWRSSAGVIVQVNKEQKLMVKETVDKFVNEPDNISEIGVEKQHFYDGSSSYEDSDGYVNSPGESEDDDIRGMKYTGSVPVVTEHTDWSKWVWVVGTRFPNKNAFRSAIRNYAVANGKNLKVHVSDTKRGERLGVRCTSGCPFRVYASYHQKKCTYMVKSVTSKHTCQRNMSRNTQLSTEFVADYFLHVFKVKPQWPGKEIQDAIRSKFKIIVNNWFVYKAKRIAHTKLHGSMRDHYSKIGSYLAAMQDANPTSTFKLETVPPRYFNDYTSNTDVFFRLFICFDSVKSGFLSGCRRVLCLDGCFLKTFLGGMLLCAIGRDPNDQMFPVAWAVVEGENTLSWTWFMYELKKALEVQDDGKGYTLISDQQKGLLNAVVTHWGNAEHRNCARHIYANWHKKHKGEELKGLFWKAARAYCEADFLIAIEDMKTLNREAAESFLKQNPKTFCRCYLHIDTKCDVIVNNMAETFNGYIIRSRSKHIIFMLEDIRVSIMTRLVKLQNLMSANEGMICPRVQKKVDKEKALAYKCEVFPSSEKLYQVKSFDWVKVDTTNMTCSCRKWELTGIPCYHACAVVEFLCSRVEDFVHVYYKGDMHRRAYGYTIPPLASDKYWPRVHKPLDPPPIKVQPGRPKKNRKKDPHEDGKKPGKLSRHGRIVACSNCGGNGHNKRRCQEPAKDKGSAKEKKPRGRPRKATPTDATTQASQSTK